MMKKYKVLFIDDIIENLQTLISMFESQFPNYELFQVNNSLKAVEIIKRVQPDLIITDWNMPNLDGIGLIKELKSDENLQDIPVIMATGVNLSSRDLEKALEVGAIDFLRKPIDPIELKARTRSALTISEMHQQQIETKNNEVAESTLLLVKNNEFNINMLKKLNLILKDIKDDDKLIEQIGGLIDDIESKINEESWQKFEIAMDSINANFNKRLLKKFPDLTKSELKLCDLLRLDLSNKEIASILYVTADSLKVSRSRLRKKLNLSTKDNLQLFLSSI